MNALAQTPRQMPSAGYSAGELTVELAKMLALVAPITMTVEQQELWLRAAADSLEDIRANEVAAISAEVRRKVVRHNQIVPEIARLVAERRSRPKAPPRPLPELPPRAFAQPLSRFELDNMKPQVRSLGLKYGHLEYRDGMLVERAA